MILSELKTEVINIIDDLKNNGNFPKENNHIDYKKKLKLNNKDDIVEQFLINFAKDIIAFSNSDGGIVVIGIEELAKNTYNDVGLEEENYKFLNSIDLNKVTQSFEKMIKVGVTIDLQPFQISTRRFYYLLIQKSNQVLIPINNYERLKLKKGEIYYRASGKNETANKSTLNFNRFMQIKANERSKEFMEIWSKLLPEMFDINPREVLILNPIHNKVYGFNSKEGVLSSSEIEVDKSKDGIFNIILNAISAGEIGKITTNEGKPIYKIVGELYNNREHIMFNSVVKEVQANTKYNFISPQLKELIYKLGWVKSAKFPIINPPKDTVNKGYYDYLWIEVLDNSSNREKIFFSQKAIDDLIEKINNPETHIQYFGKNLNTKEDSA